MVAGQYARQHATPRLRWPPPIGLRRCYILLALLGRPVLGLLGGVIASYMNFSIGFFVGGPVLAGIQGSVVTLGYGRKGKPGANCMQTGAASVAGVAGMRVLIQAMVWMGLPRPPVRPLRMFQGAAIRGMASGAGHGRALVQAVKIQGSRDPQTGQGGVVGNRQARQMRRLEQALLAQRAPVHAQVADSSRPRHANGWALAAQGCGLGVWPWHRWRRVPASRWGQLTIPMRPMARTRHGSLRARGRGI